MSSTQFRLWSPWSGQGAKKAGIHPTPNLGRKWREVLSLRLKFTLYLEVTMFVLFNQLSDNKLVCFDVKNIKLFYPGVHETLGEGTVIELYRGEDWIVSQTMTEVHEACNGAREKS